MTQHNGDTREQDAGPTAAVQHRVRAYRWSAVGLAVFAILLTGLVGWLMPTSFARAFGVATEVTATVRSIELASEQPRKQRHGPQWSIGLEWSDDGTRQGTALFTTEQVPFSVGDQVSAFVTGGSDQVSLGIDTDEPGAAWTMLAILLVTLASSGFFLRSAGHWKRLLTVPREREPARVSVIRHQRSKGGWGVDYRPVSGVRMPHTLGLVKRGRMTPPEPGEELEVWSMHPGGGGPLLVRQSDGTWWAASGSLH